MHHWKESDDLNTEHIDEVKHRACAGKQDASTAGGKILREYWLSFAKTGVPSSATAADAGIQEWTKVETSDGPENRLGMPFMRLDFSVDGMRAEKTKMSDSPWSTPASAQLLGDITCSSYDDEDKSDTIGIDDFGTADVCEQKAATAAAADWYQREGNNDESTETWYNNLRQGTWCQGGCHRRRGQVPASR